MSSLLPTDVTLGETLREFREQRELTQRELARRLRIPVRSLQEYERGAIPHAKRRGRILAFLAREAAKAA